ncbi:pentatricopeptide repeat-containing protein At1g02150 [Euphorbia lathyris]|uniref:pentatricopeptide repeat-containing protein At1g02150 n=1 Tax=Euphorbia lathyris TaxID=212925 RepID=UPI0033131EFF
MLLQPSLYHQKAALSSTISYSPSLPWRNPHFTLRKTLNYNKLPITCSISQVHSYGAMDYERRPMIKWNSIYKKISLMENPELGAGKVLNEMEKSGKKLTKWELCRVVKELRKFKRHKYALEVYDWMNSREERFKLTASDAAIQLDLISKVRGVSSAEDFFEKVTDKVKDRRIYGALLNAYVRANMREKAESLIEKMRLKNYATHALPFNVMMTLYMNLKEYEKVETMVSEMREKKIQLDIYSYNIWLSSRGSQGSEDRMEEVFELMKADTSSIPNWTTFSTMATMYIKMGQLEKAEDCLRRVESRITGRDRIPYHYLLSLYGNVGNKEEVHRVWNVYKSIFPSIPNLGYHAIISSLIRMDDIGGAEKIYEEWLAVKVSYDPRIGNLLMGWYVRQGNSGKADVVFKQMVESGGKPNASTWEILTDGHIRDKRISEAVSSFKEAFVAEGSRSWKPKPVIVSSFFELCDEEGDTGNRRVLEGLFRDSGLLRDENYASLIGLSPTSNEVSGEEDRSDDINENETLVEQLQGSL